MLQHWVPRSLLLLIMEHLPSEVLEHPRPLCLWSTGISWACKQVSESLSFRVKWGLKSSFKFRSSKLSLLIHSSSASYWPQCSFQFHFLAADCERYSVSLLYLTALIKWCHNCSTDIWPNSIFLPMFFFQPESVQEPCNVSHEWLLSKISLLTPG